MSDDARIARIGQCLYCEARTVNAAYCSACLDQVQRKQEATNVLVSRKRRARAKYPCLCKRTHENDCPRHGESAVAQNFRRTVRPEEPHE